MPAIGALRYSLIACAHLEALHHICGLHLTGGQRSGELAGYVDADPGQGLDDGGVELVDGCGASRGNVHAPSRLVAEPRRHRIRLPQRLPVSARWFTRSRRVKPDFYHGLGI